MTSNMKAKTKGPHRPPINGWWVGDKVRPNLKRTRATWPQLHHLINYRFTTIKVHMIITSISDELLLWFEEVLTMAYAFHIHGIRIHILSLEHHVEEDLMDYHRPWY